MTAATDLPAWLRKVLPADTAHRWVQMRDVLPSGSVLVDGTALTTHLHHRISRDLDFFLTEPFDSEALSDTLSQLDTFAVTLLDDDSLNGVLGSTKVQFLRAVGQSFVEPVQDIAGIPVAGLGDILATKLKVIQDRGEHRDYFDIKTIEQRGGRSVEEGFTLFVNHYHLHHPEAALVEIVRGLGYHDDLVEDPEVPEPLAETTAYWRIRARELALG